MRLHDQGVDVSWDVLDGSPYSEIANAIQPEDLVVITSHGRGAIMRRLLGAWRRSWCAKRRTGPACSRCGSRSQ